MAAQTPQQKMVKARANLVMGHPFFGTLALRLKVSEDASCKTGWTDGVQLKYNPKFVQGLSLEQTEGFIAHLVMHPALLHHTRRGVRDKKKWNRAADYAVNNILTESGFVLPNDLMVHAGYKDKPVETIYTLIPDDPPQGQDSKSSGGGGKGQKDKDGGGGGSGEDDSDPGGCGEVRDKPGSDSKSDAPASESEMRQEESEWKIAVAQAAHVAKQAGKLPASMARVLEDLLEPVLPWRDILRRFMTEKTNDDFSWMRGNRRFLAQGLYLPSRRSDDAAGDMVVIIDTSGSIGAKELQEFGNEINGIHKDVRPKRLFVIYCDAAVNHVDIFEPEDDVKLSPYGGGGTDFRPPFKYIQKHQIEPKCAVYLTDGYGPFPEEKDVQYPVMWAINNDQVMPPFGEHLIFSVN